MTHPYLSSQQGSTCEDTRDFAKLSQLVLDYCDTRSPISKQVFVQKVKEFHKKFNERLCPIGYSSKDFIRNHPEEV